MMLIPALVVMWVDWDNSRQQLAVLDGPGLASSFDASLELARLVLDQQRKEAQAATDLVAAWVLGEEPGSLPTGSSPIWWRARRVKAKSWQLEPGSGLARDDSMPSPDAFMPANFNPAAPDQPRRWKTSQGSFLVARSPVKDDSGNWILLAHPLPKGLDFLLDEVSRGGAGVRQLRHFYSRLLQSNMVLTLGVLTLFLLVVSLLLSHRLARYVARPLQELSRGTDRVAAGDLTHQVQVSAPAELGRLVTSFNRMTKQLLQGREDLRRAERIAAWQGVARRLAHEIKNPLTPITLAMHRIGKKSDDPTITSCVRTVLEEASNLGRIADEFSLYAKLPQPKPQRMSAEQMRELLESLAQFYLARTRVVYDWLGWPATFSLWVDAGQMRQVLGNLIKNGNEATQGEGTLVFEVATVPEPGQIISSEHSGPWIRVTIRDTGCGLPEKADQVFEPYVTTKATGTGLGLAMARRIIEDNGGCLWAESSEGGAAFIIDLPDVSQIDDSQLALPERNSS